MVFVKSKANIKQVMAKARALWWLVYALLCFSVCSQKIPSFKQGYYGTGVKGAGSVAKSDGDVGKNASEKAPLGVEKVKIKIADPPTLSRVPAPYSATSKTLVLRAQPASISYPSHLYQLSGECFSTTEKGYKYVVCPFFNVTQKEMSSGWNKFEGVLGVWREWVIENDTITGMQFVMGEKCGSTDREATVYFNCSTLTTVHTIKEPHTCKYSMWLDTPLACFKGAMQVYHLLNEEQLKRWDSLDDFYYAGEITEQGLKAKRREILIEANLLYSHEQTEHVVSASKDPQKASPYTAPTPAAHVEKKDSKSLLGSHMPLTHCIEQNMALRKELKELKSQLEELLTLIGEFPSVAASYAALKNGTGLLLPSQSVGTAASSSGPKVTASLNPNGAELVHAELGDNGEKEVHYSQDEDDRELFVKEGMASDKDGVGPSSDNGFLESHTTAVDGGLEVQKAQDKAHEPVERELLREDGRDKVHVPTATKKEVQQPGQAAYTEEQGIKKQENLNSDDERIGSMLGRKHSPGVVGAEVLGEKHEQQVIVEQKAGDKHDRNAGRESL